MISKKLCALTAAFALVISSCNNSNDSEKKAARIVVDKNDTMVVAEGASSKGIGRFKEVPLTHPLDETMIATGKTIFDAKCNACHKLTTEKLVGPGWSGTTDRHTPEWIMNFITNTEVMLNKDLAAQAEVVSCLVRMPNQDLTDAQARAILEFMRKNDGKQ